MEFLKALEKAVKLGMTVEEFLPIWDLEYKSKRILQSDATGVNNNSIRHNQVEFSDTQESVIMSRQQWCQMKDKLLEDLQTQASILYNKSLEREKMQWNELRQWQDQLQKEVLNHFEILNNHIATTIENCGSSLKLFIMQEVNVLGQNLEKILENKTNVHERVTTPCSDMNTMGCLNEQSDTYVKCLDLSINVQNDKHSVGEIQQKTQANHDTVACTEGIFIQNQQVNVNYNSTNISSLKAPSTSTSNKQSTKGVVSHTKSALTLEQKKTLSDSAHSSCVPKEDKSSTYLEKTEIAPINSSGVDNSMNVGSTTDDEKNEEEQSINLIPTRNFHFYIPNSEVFASSHQEYTTVFYNLKSNVCRIRFRLYFNADSQLSVLFLVANGKCSDGDKWPISFTGIGFIYNNNSNGYTQVWSLGPVKCSKPQVGKEIEVKVAVNLRTLKHNIPDVTYKILCDKGYTVKNQLLFDWELTAVEASKKSCS